MMRIIAYLGILIITGLFVACPTREVTEGSALPIRIQGHVYDNQTKQSVAGNYVGLYLESRAETGLYTLRKLLETQTDKDGFYSLQYSLSKESCTGAMLFLTPVGSDNGTGTRIGCTDALQTIDLYK
jgi:hypothetical protein